MEKRLSYSLSLEFYFAHVFHKNAISFSYETSFFIQRRVTCSIYDDIDDIVSLNVIYL